MTCPKCHEEIKKIYSIAGDGPDDYLPSCGCIDWDGWIALSVVAILIALFVLVERITG